MNSTTTATSAAIGLLTMARKSGLFDKGELEKYLSGLSNVDAMTADELAAKMQADGLLTEFQASHLLKGRYKNFLIGKYKVLEPLGAGGMSQVFLCEHSVMKHRVALKLLPIKDSSDPEAVSRFLREARAAAAVNHPNVVRAHDVDKADGKLHYIVMDYVDGVNLHDLVKRIGVLPPEQAANYIAQASIGLQEIATKGLIHRDLKPSNLLLDRDGVIRILDLGLARFAEDDKDNVTRRFNSESVFGTADYLAPEQALQQDAVDARADIYSLGATFYFLLSGTAPFENASIAQKLLAHQMRDPAPIPNLPPGMMQVLAKMMAKKPEDRYQEAYDIAADLATWANMPLSLPDDNFFPRGSSNSGPHSSGPRTGPPSTRTTGKTMTTGRYGRYPGVAPTSDIFRGASNTGRISGATLPEIVATQPRSTAKIAIGGAIAAAVLVGGLFAGGVFSKKNAPNVANNNSTVNPLPQVKVEPKAEPAVPPPAGSIVVGTSGAFRTVAEALAKAPANSRIVLVNEEHVESLTIAKPPAGLVIQGWPETRPVRWKSATDGPALVLDAAAGVTVSHVHFNGGNRVSTLVELKGDCGGTVLDAVQLEQFTKYAVVVNAASGDTAKPLTLRRLRILGGSGAVGVRLAGAAKNIVIERGRFEGTLEPAIDIVGVVDNVNIQHNRFHMNTAAVACAESPAAGGVKIVNNAFGECGSGLALTKLPSTADRLVLRNNLFIKSSFTATYAPLVGQKLELPVTWVWHDEGLEDTKMTNTPEGVRYFRKVFELKSAATDAVLDVGAVTSFKVWVNGQQVGESSPKHFTKRVYAFAVGPLLKVGKNVIAIEATHTKDPLNAGFAVAGGLVARLSQPGREGPPLAQVDASWKSSDFASAEWNTATFDDGTWKPVLPWTKTGYNFPWQGSVWDSVARQKLNVATGANLILAEGNVRDYDTNEGFPLSNSIRGVMDKEKYKVLFDPESDEMFLRTPRVPVKLLTAGSDGGPVGVMPGK